MANICRFCGESYEYQNRIAYDIKGNVIGCWHDSDFIPTGYDLDSVKKQRAEHAKDLVQPYNQDGSINRDFKKLYPKSEFITRYEKGNET